MASQSTRQKRVLAIHDISCAGKCSLTVALPILSAAGIETVVIPTAVLSTHTGGFTGYTCRDLTDDILPIAAHWQTLGMRFDAIYTGYLGSFRQLDIVAEVIGRLRGEDTLVVVDPVMADHGALYSNFTSDFPDGMRRLAGLADVLVPNMTEAALLLGEEYRSGPYTREYTDGMLRRLRGLGPDTAVLTGVFFDGRQLGAGFLGGTREPGYALQALVPGVYHGTGDVFASALVAGLVRALDLRAACTLAAAFTAASVRRTVDAGTDIRFGVNFEAGLYDFAKQIGDGR